MAVEVFEIPLPLLRAEPLPDGHIQRPGQLLHHRQSQLPPLPGLLHLLVVQLLGGNLHQIVVRQSPALDQPIDRLHSVISFAHAREATGFREFFQFRKIDAIPRVSIPAMKILPMIAALALFPAALHAGEKWVPLFNGKNLDGWTPKTTGFELGTNYKNTFRVEDGLLKVRFDGYDKFGGHFGHLFFKKPFKNYRFRIEYRFVGKQVPGGPAWAKRNSGIMIHCQAPETMGKEQKFPVSIEVQLLGGLGKGDRPTANLCTPGTNVVIDDQLFKQHCLNSTSPTFNGEEWVNVEVEVRGDHIKHFVNGKLVLEYDKPQLDPRDRDAQALIELADGKKLLRGGFISLQAESHPVDFRKIEILELP